VRDKWYGDNRDIVKWATILHLAREHGIEHILQVAFYRPCDFWGHHISVNGIDQTDIPQAVREHFPRDIHDISRLGQAAGVSIDVFARIFERPSDAYIHDVTGRITAYAERPLIVFLDPDTGIAPDGGAELKHVSRDELQSIYESLHSRDVLVVYQHKWRDGEWVGIAKQRLWEAIRVREDSVSTFTCSKVANDVAFFAVEKP
jgi:hypothetical protein